MDTAPGHLRRDAWGAGNCTTKIKCKHHGTDVMVFSKAPFSWHLSIQTLRGYAEKEPTPGSPCSLRLQGDAHKQTRLTACLQPRLGPPALLDCREMHTNKQGRLPAYNQATSCLAQLDELLLKQDVKSPLVPKKTLSSCFLGPSDPFPLQVWFQSSATFGSFNPSLALKNIPHRHSLWPWVKEPMNSSTDFHSFSWNFSIFFLKGQPFIIVGKCQCSTWFFYPFGIFTALDLFFPTCFYSFKIPFSLGLFMAFIAFPMVDRCPWARLFPFFLTKRCLRQKKCSTC